MSRKPFFWLCPCCFARKRGDPGTYICLNCSEDMSNLRNIYTIIVGRFPALDKESMAAVFRRLWLKFQKENPPGTKPPPAKKEAQLFPCTLSINSCSGEYREMLCEEAF